MDIREWEIAFRLIRNNSWLGNEEETVCQEVPWTSQEMYFQSMQLKRQINVDASSLYRT